MKRAAMIIAPEKFRDEELFEPKEILEKAGISVTVVSTGLSPAKGVKGGIITPEARITDLNTDDYDALIFVGGGGSSVYWDNPVAHALSHDTVKKGKILAAICIAPVTLARAGVLRGRRATVWPSEAEQLSTAGAQYTARSVEKDGNIITGSGPTAAREFGEEIKRALFAPEEKK